MNDSISVHCNAGNVMVDMMGDLPGYGSVWYYPHAIANILSLCLVSLRLYIQYNSRESACFMVWKDNGICRRFRPGTRVLYYLDYGSKQEMVLLTDAIIQNNESDDINTVAKISVNSHRDNSLTQRMHGDYRIQ